MATLGAVSALKELESTVRLSRRRLLAWLGGIGLAAFLPGCGDDEAPSGPAEEAAEGTNPDCVLSPELTEGPYYLDLDLIRSDIVEDRPGVPLALRVTVVDADGCAPLKDVAVDVWHCDASGVYSGVQGEGGTFLRGIQMTDTNGVAEFQTIYPGWYTGRAVHIHVKAHVGGSETYTGQLFFEEGDTAEVYGQDPYSARPSPDTSNSDDGIFGQGGDSTIVALRQTRDGYRGTVTLGIARA
jgi:protocatechuate 3,4-dioxygenase beta subunit